MTKWFVALGVLVVLTVSFMLAKGKQEEPVVKPKVVQKKEVVKAPWDGNGFRPVNTTFLRSVPDPANAGQMNQTHALKIVSLGFSGLNTRATNVDVNITVNANGINKPDWLNEKTFKAVNSSQRYYNADTKIKRTGTQFNVTLKFYRVPTAALGPVCEGDSGQSLGLVVNAPDGIFTVALKAPDAPQDHCNAENKTGKIKKSRVENDEDRKQVERAAFNALAEPLPKRLQ